MKFSLSHPHYRRDSNSTALLNTDTAAVEAYKQKREKSQQLERDINSLKNRIDELERAINQILRNTTCQPS